MSMFDMYLLGVLVTYLFGITNEYKRRKEIDDVVILTIWLVLGSLISWIGCKDQNMGSIYGCNSAMLSCNRMKFEDRYRRKDG